MQAPLTRTADPAVSAPRTSWLALASALAVFAWPGAAVAEPPPAAETAPLVHLQVDKPLHRVGEMVWWRVHAPLQAAATAWPLTVRLVDASGAVVIKKTLPAPSVMSGAFFLEPELMGGSYWLEARGPAGEVLHRTQLEVWAMAKAAPWRLRLTVLNDVHYPGGLVTATARVTTTAGKPVVGERIEVLGTFDEIRVRAQAGPTDAEGRCVVRFTLPEGVRRSGYLAIGAAKGKAKTAKAMAATAEPVRVSAGVSRVDAFVEGGAVIPSAETESAKGRKHRVGLFVRDLDGEPAVVEGRVFDDQQACVGTFKSDRYGHALVDVPYAAERRYTVRIDRPAGVATTFPLPAPAGRPFALRLEPKPIPRRRSGVATEAPADGVQVRVWGASKTVKPVEVHLVDRDGNAFFKTVRVSRTQEATAVFAARLRGLRYVLLASRDRVYARAPLMLGSRSPLEVRFQQRAPKGRPLPGQRVVLDVQTLLKGKPVSADLALSVYNAGARPKGAQLSSLVARALLQPHMRGPVHDGSDLFGAAGAVAVDAATQARRRAYLITRCAYRYPAAGIARPASLVELVRDVRTHRVSVPAIAARTPTHKATVQRPTPLEALMIRAAHARARAPRPKTETQFGVAVSAKKAKRHVTPGVGKPAKKAPQETRLRRSKIDDRDTRFWKGRVATDANGRTRVAFRVGNEATPLIVSAQGFASVAGIDGVNGASDAVVTAETTITPRRFFQTEFAFPNHLRVGDVCTVYVTVKPQDETPRTPFQVALRVPSCLKALTKTVVQRNPRVNGARTKFQFEVVSLAKRAALTAVVTRGRYREVTRRAFSVDVPAMEVGFGASGLSRGESSVVVEIPRSVVPGSIRSRARVSPTAQSQATEGLEEMLRQPSGCFEQSSSSNYPNLAILSVLRDRGADAGVLERAFRLAREGHAKILSFQHENGGFSLWGPGKTKKSKEAPEVRYTALAIRQLGLHASLFQGEGLIELQQAVTWLDQQTKASHTEKLFTLLAVNEAGVPWKGRQRAKDLKPKTAFETALLANALARWPEGIPYNVNGKASREVRLNKLLDTLEKTLDPKTGLQSKGEGLMGSRGEQLSVEATALAGVALDIGERTEGARHALGALARARSTYGGWSGTQATALAIQAVTRLARHQVDKPVVVGFRAGPSGSLAKKTQPKGSDRPLVFVKAAKGATPGKPFALSLSIDAELDAAWSLGCTWQVLEPQSRPDAPYRLAVASPATMVVGSESELRVVIRRTNKAAPKGQVTMQIGLPAGCWLGTSDAAWAKVESELEGIGRIEEREGKLVLYWNRDPLRNSSERVLRLPIVPRVAGTFRTGPSSIYPYYETGREAYAAGGRVKIQDAYDTDVAAAKAKGVTGVAGQPGQAGQATSPTPAGR